MKSRLSGLAILATGLFLLSPLNLAARENLKIHVSILPQKYFVEQIAKEHAVVDVLVKPGKNPSTYSPSPDQIKKLALSDIYFRIGVAFENGFMHKISSITQKTLIVDTRKGIALRDMGNKDGHGNPDHGHPGNHLGKDPHIWMSPVLVKQQARTILSSLVHLDPDNRSDYEKNYAVFEKNLDRLHIRMADTLKDLRGENLFVFHPAFGYFTDAYALNQVAVETMGKAPKGKNLSALIKLAKKENARVIFVQPQFDRHSARKIASAIKGAVVSIDPLAYDYLANMENIAAAIAKTLKE